MREDVSRSEVVCEEEVARSFLTQALSREGEVCALKTFVAKAGHMIAECEAVCQLGDDQVLRAVAESQAVVRSINSMAASGDRHRLVGAADPHTTFSLKLPVSNVHDALAQMSALVVPVLVQGLDGVEHEIEVGVFDTGRDLLRKVASAVGLREGCFHLSFGDEVIAEGEDVVQLRGHRVVVTHSNTEKRKQDAIAALRALGETTLTSQRLKPKMKQVTNLGTLRDIMWTLDWSRCGFSDEEGCRMLDKVAKERPQTIAYHTAWTLKFGDNRFGVSFVRHLIEHILSAQPRLVKVLELPGCDLTDDCLRHITHWLNSSAKIPLHKLIIHRNRALTRETVIKFVQFADQRYREWWPAFWLDVHTSLFRQLLQPGSREYPNQMRGLDSDTDSRHVAVGWWQNLRYR